MTLNLAVLEWVLVVEEQLVLEPECSGLVSIVFYDPVVLQIGHHILMLCLCLAL